MSAGTFLTSLPINPSVAHACCRRVEPSKSKVGLNQFRRRNLIALKRLDHRVCSTLWSRSWQHSLPVRPAGGKIMWGRISTPLGAVAVVGTILLSGILVGPRANTAHADNCLTAPKSSAPTGSHWYYHTDRATQRKCWYLGTLDQPAQHPVSQTTSQATPTNPVSLEKPATASGGAPMSVTPGAGSPPLPHIKMLTVVSSGATEKLVQQGAKQRNTTSITSAPTPEEDTSQTGDQATEPARAATIVWPNPPTPRMATAQDPIATPTAAPTEAASTEADRPTSNARASADDAEDTAQADASTNSAVGAKASAFSEPVESALVAAF